MTAIAAQRSLALSQAGLRRDMIALMGRGARSAGAAIQRYAGTDGIIPITRADSAARDAGTAIQLVFTSEDGRTSVLNDGTPVSPLARTILFWEAFAVREIARTHAAFIQKRTPPDVLAWLNSAVIPRMDPTTGIISEQEDGTTIETLRRAFDHLRLFRPNPLVGGQFDPNRQWVRPDKWIDNRGYTLSQRIWEAGQRTRAKLDALTLDAIRSGMGALELSRQIEQFVIPGRAAIRTQKPYGTDASFDAMRLARTEIGRVHGQASWLAGYMNPYVETMTWALSPQHPKIDICDDLAGASPYRLETCPIPVSDSHPQCLCHLRANVGDSPAAVTRQLREAMEESRRVNLLPNMTPTAADTFTRLLLGEAIWSILRQVTPIQPVLFG